MTVAPAETSTRRFGLRQRWERLHSSDALKNVLEECALWTALWTAFPLSGELGLARDERSQP